MVYHWTANPYEEVRSLPIPCLINKLYYNLIKQFYKILYLNLFHS